MRRRDFCKLIETAAAWATVPAPGQTSEPAHSTPPSGFDRDPLGILCSNMTRRNGTAMRKSASGHTGALNILEING
jgi:hypothetical protein